MKKTVIGLAVMAGCLALASAVQAVELTYILEGTITQKNDPSHLVDVISEGDKVTYTVLVDSETPNLNMPGSARYDAISASLQIGVNTFECEVPWVWVIADWSTSNASQFSVPVFTSFGAARASGEFALIDWGKAAISDDALPSLPYDFAPFDQRYLSLRITNPNVYGDYSTVSGSFDRFTIIPEPISWILMACLAGVGSLQHRRTVTRG